MHDEKVLVVKTKFLKKILDLSTIKLFTSFNNEIRDIILYNCKYIPRNLAENDLDYKQIIPYAMVTHQDKFLLLKRYSTQSESRLHNKYSLGIGGHINPSDENSSLDIVSEALKREMDEEIFINHTNIPELIGVINDDDSDVGKHHLCIFYLFKIDDPNYSVVESDKMEAHWVTKENLKNKYDIMESWSQIIYDYYITKNAKFTF